MKIPDKSAVATEIRRIMAEKQISGVDLGKALKTSPTTVSQIRNGNSSYTLMKRALDTLDTWEDAE